MFTKWIMTAWSIFHLVSLKKKRLGLDEGLAIVLRTTDYLSPRGGRASDFFGGGGNGEGISDVANRVQSGALENWLSIGGGIFRILQNFRGKRSQVNFIVSRTKSLYPTPHPPPFFKHWSSLHFKWLPFVVSVSLKQGTPYIQCNLIRRLMTKKEARKTKHKKKSVNRTFISAVSLAFSSSILLRSSSTSCCNRARDMRWFVCEWKKKHFEFRFSYRN